MHLCCARKRATVAAFVWLLPVIALVSATSFSRTALRFRLQPGRQRRRSIGYKALWAAAGRCPNVSGANKMIRIPERSAQNRRRVATPAGASSRFAMEMLCLQTVTATMLQSK